MTMMMVVVVLFYPLSVLSSTLSLSLSVFVFRGAYHLQQGQQQQQRWRGWMEGKKRKEKLQGRFASLNSEVFPAQRMQMQGFSGGPWIDRVLVARAGFDSIMMLYKVLSFLFLSLSLPCRALINYRCPAAPPNRSDVEGKTS